MDSHGSSARRRGAPGPDGPGRLRWRRAGALVVLAAAAAALAMAAFAAAKSSTLGTGQAKLNGPSGSRTEVIAVNSRGVAIYASTSETSHHLRCTSTACLALWSPVKVGASARLTKAAGVKGRLGKFKRNGFTQLTLNGRPVYTFTGDGGRRGVAHGDGQKDFGGTWHVFKEAQPKRTGSTPPTTGSSSTTTSSTSSSPYGY